MGEAAALFLGPVVAVMIQAFTTDTEIPLPPPPSRAENICHPVVYDPATGGVKVDRSIDKCARARIETQERHQ
jgi:hypothetical protein